MTAERVSVAVVQRRLLAISQLLDDLRGRGEITEVRLLDERLTLLALERILTQVVHRASDVNAHLAAATGTTPQTDTRSGFDALVGLGVLNRADVEELKPSVGVRNVLVHVYARVQSALVVQGANRMGPVYS